MVASWNFKQELVCCFGKPIAENPTQYMIESAFRHHGLNWRYLNFEIDADQLGDAMRAMRTLGFRGGNCTIPNKVAVLAHLDRLGDSATLMGAVNCIVRHGHELVGENTDGKGFVQSLRQIVDPQGMNLVILGAGGAARAIAVELALASAAKLTIVNRNAQRGTELAQLLARKLNVDAHYVPWQGIYRLPPEIHGLVNATSIGLYPDVEAQIPLDLRSLLPHMVVADVIPNPPRTRLIRDAAERGCKVIDGLGMLVNQGVLGFRYWTGIEPDASVMRRALEEVFGTGE